MTSTKRDSSAVANELNRINTDLGEFIRERNLLGFLQRVNHPDCKGHICRLVRRRTYHQVDSTTLFDIFQFVLIALTEKFQEESIPLDNPIPYIFAVARNCAITECRRQSRSKRPHFASVVLDLLSITHASSVPSPDSALRHQELICALKEITIDKLSPFQQKVFDAYRDYRETQPNARIKLETLADRVSKQTHHPITPAQIRSALREALRKVRDELIRRRVVTVEEAGSEHNGSRTRRPAGDPRHHAQRHESTAG